MLRIALVTCARPPEPDPDEGLLLVALRRAGVEAQMIAWDDPAPEHDPARFGLIALRSTWNYYANPPAFLAWCERAAAVSRLVNPPDVVRWNFHKRYLAELEMHGVAVVPTVFLDGGSRADVGAIVGARSWGDFVVKPSVSAGSFRTRRFGAGERAEAQAFLDGELRSRDMMIQPYLPSVETAGELSVVSIEGEVTHAVRKSPRFAGGVESVSEALDPAPVDHDFAHRAIEASGLDPLYARVDIMRDGAGRPLLSELELIEPSLFLQQSPAALDRFVRALVDAAS